jgi:hypothetical protein
MCSTAVTLECSHGDPHSGFGRRLGGGTSPIPFNTPHHPARYLETSRTEHRDGLKRPPYRGGCGWRPDHPVACSGRPLHPSISQLHPVCAVQRARRARAFEAFRAATRSPVKTGCQRATRVRGCVPDPLPNPAPYRSDPIPAALSWPYPVVPHTAQRRVRCAGKRSGAERLEGQCIARLDLRRSWS